MKHSLAHIIVVATVFVATIVGHGFWYAVIATKSAEVAELQNQIVTKTETVGRVVASRTTLAEISGDEATVRNYFVPETEVVPFIDNLEARARAQAAGMKVLSVSVDNSSPDQPFLVLSLSVSGSFDSVMRTVGAIEFAPYDLSISKFSFNKGEKNVWSANLELIVGSVRESAAANTRDTAQKVISLRNP